MTETPKAAVTMTERGFEKYADFVDERGVRIRVQESSAAFVGPRCWIFLDVTEKATYDRTRLERGAASGHFTLDEVIALRDALNFFIERAPPRLAALEAPYTDTAPDEDKESP